VPYLQEPPAVIPIDLGRQLFVDDFLIDSTNLSRCFGKPQWHEGNPLLTPETDEELDSGYCPVAAPFKDGVWYDPQDGYYKMWYESGWFHTTALAISRDGLHWRRPDFDVVPGTNLVWPPKPKYERDGSLVWLDHEAADPAERFKMFQFFRYGEFSKKTTQGASWLHTSPDGIHWSEPVEMTPVGDNTSFFYNPFRHQWCMSIRRMSKADDKLRVRCYRESEDFLGGAQWNPDTQEVFWQTTDRLDAPDPARPDHPVALYDLNAVAYESLMLGVFGVFRGPENDICIREGVPKIIDLELGFSRDGFHFDRPDRTPFLASTRKTGDWNRAYLHAAGGVCLVVNNLIFFYCTGFSGISPKLKVGESGSIGRSRRLMYAGGSTGLATLRRDGFASMDSGRGGGELTTRPLVFKGNHLFVNVNNPQGELRVGVLNRDGKAAPGLDVKDCAPISLDSTRAQVRWSSGTDIGALAGRPMRFRFQLRGGKLFSFGVTDDPAGASYGYMAGGGPGFIGGRDLPTKR
jgi:hypothetical protein